MAPILPIFLTINEHSGQLLVGSNALWHTQPKFWAHAAVSPMLSGSLKVQDRQNDGPNFSARKWKTK